MSSRPQIRPVPNAGIPETNTISIWRELTAFICKDKGGLKLAQDSVIKFVVEVSDD
jgi:hypothetical protein